MHDIVDDKQKKKDSRCFFGVFFLAFIRLEYIYAYFHEENIVTSNATLQNTRRTNREKKR
jgi:hypothetical protein